MAPIGDETRRRNASDPPPKTGSAEFDLDSELLEFLLDTEPPPLELGSVPPSTYLRSLDLSSSSLRPPSVPSDLSARVERVRVPDIARPPPKHPTPPPAPPLTVEMRAQRLTKQLETVGPGLEAPAVQQLLKLGPEVMPALHRAFPGLLWFNRRLPHRAVARGRDVSPIARALVAFGDDSAMTVAKLMLDPHPDIRFYATLVAQDLATPSLLDSLAQATLDDDAGVREVAAAALIGLGGDATARASHGIRKVMVEGALSRPHLMFAIGALTRLRDVWAPRHLVPLLGPADPDLNDLAIRALAVLTGQTLATDTAAWNAWIEANEDEPRWTWLCDSLERGHASVFKYVCDELAHVTGECLGEASVDDPEARRRLAEAYREHWKARGDGLP